jgi:SAM-dependent methyltransferase
VYGIDASPAMIAKAMKKARKAGADVTFRHAAVEALPFPDSTFDVISSTLMLHHLPMKTRREGLAEMRRVLKPSGRILVVDFGRPQRKRGLFAHVHRHGHVDVSGVVDMLRDAGLAIVDRGAVGFSSLQFVLASAPNCEVPEHIHPNERAYPSRSSFVRVAIGLGAILVILAHLGVLAALIGGLRAVLQRIAQP